MSKFVQSNSFLIQAVFHHGDIFLVAVAENGGALMLSGDAPSSAGTRHKVKNDIITLGTH